MSKENRVSDERLTLIASGIADRLGAGASGAPDLERDIASAITELLSLRSKPVAAVEVNPLEWLEDGHNEWGASSIVGHYAICRDADGDFWADGPQGHFKLCSALEEAKAAAEADYRQRILSTLSLPAQEPIRRDGWRQRLEDLATEIEIGNATAAAAIVEELLEGLGDVEEMATIAPQPEAVITEEWLRDTAMNVMLATEVEEAARILRSALEAALKEPSNG